MRRGLMCGTARLSRAEWFGSLAQRPLDRGAFCRLQRGGVGSGTKARGAKVRQESKPAAWVRVRVSTKPVKRTMSASARRKIAALGQG
jgi:hypothetical protein